MDRFLVVLQNCRGVLSVTYPLNTFYATQQKLRVQLNDILVGELVAATHALSIELA